VVGMSSFDLTGLDLPDVFPPAGHYRSAILHDGVLHTAGHIPFGADGTLVIGRVGATLTVEEGIHAARLAALSVLATVQAELGSLDRVDRFLRVFGVVNATADFGDHTKVIDGASEVFELVFGERGEHARLAVGVSSLPVGIAVEVEATIAVHPSRSS
jgi:enamine deaminase RidA (YjgF/YER057c/UK114 family)